MRAYAKQLPNVVEGGAYFSIAVHTAKKLFPPGRNCVHCWLCTWAPLLLKESDNIISDFRPKNPDFDHNNNSDYTTALTRLCVDIKKAFPRRVNTTKIRSCKKRKDELVDYYTWLLTVFSENSGINEPDSLGEEIGIWKSNLSKHFRACCLRSWMYLRFPPMIQSIAAWRKLANMPSMHRKDWRK